MLNINNQEEQNSSNPSGISLMQTSLTDKDQTSSRKLPVGVTRTEIDQNFEEKISINQKNFNFFKNKFKNIRKKPKKILFLSLLGSSSCIAGFGTLVSGYLVIGGAVLGAGFLLVFAGNYLDNIRERNLRLSMKEKSQIQEGEIGLINDKGNFQAMSLAPRPIEPESSTRLNTRSQNPPSLEI